MSLVSGSSRGQAMQLGLVLVFGILIILFSLNQAVLVPAQNEEIDFRHSKQVQEDFVSVQSAVVAAARGDDAATATVDLGTRYPPRQLAINSQPPTGRLQTSPPAPIVVENTTGGSATDVTDRVCPANVTTRSLVYHPSFSQYERAPTVVYENTVAFNEYGNGETLPLTDQQLVEDGTVSLVALTGNYSRSGASAVSIDPVETHVTGATVKNPKITLPTRLSETAWERLLAGEVDPGNVTVSSGNVTLLLSGRHRISCSEVGIGSGKQAGEPADVNEQGVALNPAGPKAVELTGVTLGANTSNVTLSFTNNDADRNRTIEQARLGFFTDDRGNDPTQAVVVDSTNTTLSVGGVIEPLATPVSVNASETAHVELRFDGPAKSDMFVFAVVYADGERVRYRIQVPGASE